MNPSKSKVTVLCQISRLIPRNLVERLASKHGVAKKSRTFSPTSHVLSLMFFQLSHAIGLNDVCDTLNNHSGVLTTIRRSTPPSRNCLSHANRNRNPEMAKELFWETLKSLESSHFRFKLEGRKYCAFPRRFKRVINVVDSTTIKLVANCMNWAKHRRRKAAAKMHLRLDLSSFLPNYVHIKSANSNDANEAEIVCSEIKAGEIVVFDKAYVDFKHLHKLSKREVSWVTRSKENMQYKTMGQHMETKGNIIRDELIFLTGVNPSKCYQEPIRLIEALIEIDGKIKKMTFITNNLEWASSSICDLYKNRWAIEVFFKEIKQTLQISDFMGYNENAVKWQLWTALLVYVLLRFIAWQSKWNHSFIRLFTALRGVLWSYLDMHSVLNFCGTAGGIPRMRANPEQCYLPGFNLVLTK
jgi:hypothetical protein